MEPIDSVVYFLIIFFVYTVPTQTGGQNFILHRHEVFVGASILWPHALADANHSYKQWAKPLPKKAYPARQQGC